MNEIIIDSYELTEAQIEDVNGGLLVALGVVAAFAAGGAAGYFITDWLMN